MIEVIIWIGKSVTVLLMVVLILFFIYTVARAISYAIYKSKEQIERKEGKNGFKDQK